MLFCLPRKLQWANIIAVCRCSRTGALHIGWVRSQARREGRSARIITPTDAHQSALLLRPPRLLMERQLERANVRARASAETYFCPTGRAVDKKQWRIQALCRTCRSITFHAVIVCRCGGCPMMSGAVVLEPLPRACCSVPAGTPIPSWYMNRAEVPPLAASVPGKSSIQAGIRVSAPSALASRHDAVLPAEH